jgi:hypothetical protein
MHSVTQHTLRMTRLLVLVLAAALIVAVPVHAKGKVFG